MASPEVSTMSRSPPEEDEDKFLSLQDNEVKKISTQEVYDIGKEIAQEMQRITADYGKGCLEGLVEKVVRTLEWLEICAVQNEELQKTKCQLLLKEDELVREKEKMKKLQTEMKGLSLVVEERGRQRDLLATKLSELEEQNRNYQEMLTAYEQAQSSKRRSKRYSTIIDEKDGASSVNFYSKTKSLDRREMKPAAKVTKSKDKDAMIDQLQRQLTEEKRKITEVVESGTIDQRRVQQRMKHMEQEVSSLTRQLSASQMLIERLKQEKTALLERSEVLNEVRAIQLATVARQDNSIDDGSSSPKFYKRDLVMILKERNELKEKIVALEEELSMKKQQTSRQSSSKVSLRKKFKDRSPNSKRASASYCSAPDIWERTEGSLVILEVPKNDVDKKSRTSSNSSSNHSLLTSSFVAPVEPRPTTNGHTHFSQLLYSSQDDDSTSL